jgi:hypothetical protein
MGPATGSCSACGYQRLGLLDDSEHGKEGAVFIGQMFFKRVLNVEGKREKYLRSAQNLCYCFCLRGFLLVTFV